MCTSMAVTSVSGHGILHGTTHVHIVHDLNQRVSKTNQIVAYTQSRSKNRITCTKIVYNKLEKLTIPAWGFSTLSSQRVRGTSNRGYTRLGNDMARACRHSTPLAALTDDALNPIRAARTGHQARARALIRAHVESPPCTHSLHSVTKIWVARCNGPQAVIALNCHLCLCHRRCVAEFPGVGAI